MADELTSAEIVEWVRREAIALIDEINERSSSRAFYGIDQTLHAKLCTVRATLALAALSPSPAETDGPFQSRVQPWMMACFGPKIAADKVERGDRLLEEVFELLQSGGYDPGRVVTLASYVWNRPAGEPAQEVGGVMVTLAAYCLAHGLDMHEAGETELARVWTKIEKIRAKQAAKAREIPHSPLPQAALATKDGDTPNEAG